MSNPDLFKRVFPRDCLLESLNYSLNRVEAVLKHFFIFQKPVSVAPVKLMETTQIRITVTSTSPAGIP